MANRNLSQDEIHAWTADMRHQQEHASTPHTRLLIHTHGRQGRQHTHAPLAPSGTSDWQLAGANQHTLTGGMRQARVWRLGSGVWMALISQAHVALADAAFPTLGDAQRWCEAQLSAQGASGPCWPPQ